MTHKPSKTKTAIGRQTASNPNHPWRQASDKTYQLHQLALAQKGKRRR
jgi:hypothetical protein